jgi:hypothetical protein
MKLCFIDLGVATVETRAGSIPLTTDTVGFLFP